MRDCIQKTSYDITKHNKATESLPIGLRKCHLTHRFPGYLCATNPRNACAQHTRRTRITGKVLDQTGVGVAVQNFFHSYTVLVCLDSKIRYLKREVVLFFCSHRHFAPWCVPALCPCRGYDDPGGISSLIDWRIECSSTSESGMT